jgi:arylsulfatase A-like enzyme
MAEFDKRGEGTTRRWWLKTAPAAAAVLASVEANSEPVQSSGSTGGDERPNIVMIISDQFRWDCVGAMGLNPMNLTPNLDAMARQGVLFRSAICNQPVCAPTRASMFTGQYPSRHGVWKNGIGLAVSANTIATALRGAGYTANYIGKWHLAGNDGETEKEKLGPVSPEHRGGFLDLWQASNVLELTSHPYEGDLYDNQGEPIHFSGIYRTDFMTQLAQKFLRSAKKPFFLTLSYLEVHHQNDIDAFVPPKEYAGRYRDFFVPQDLRPLPGSWPHQLGDYYGCVAKMDETVGTIRKTLQETGLDKNTIVLFVSDHGCNFKTRAPEYKRTPHESSIHVPLIIEGPGFNRSREIQELVSHVDLGPSLLQAAAVPVPSTMQGRSFLPLLDGKADEWRNEVYFEMSEFMTGRGLRTPQYTYAVGAPKHADWKPVPHSDEYVEYMLYDLYADPFQHTNLAGRVPYASVTKDLRSRMQARIAEASGLHPTLLPCEFPYS